MTTHGLRRFPLLVALLAGQAVAADVSPGQTPAPVASSDTTEVLTSAAGATRDEAIAAALAAAVVQVQGEGAPAQQLTPMFLQAMRDERMVRVTMANDNRIAATRLSTAVAFVPDYQVQESRREGDGRWQASVKARVVVPAARLARNRAALDVAVLPFVLMQHDEAEAGGMAAQQAMKQAQADLARFQREVGAVLGRHPRVTLHALPSTDAYATAAEVPGEVDWAALQGSTGASRFITVQVEDFRAEAVKLKGKGLTGRIDGGYTLHYRLIGREPNGKAEILRSGTFTVDTRSPWLRPLAMTTSTAIVTPEEARRRVATIQGKVADLFARTLLSELVLPQVAAREADQVVVQAGASVLRPGDTLAVLGPDIIETDSGSGLASRLDGLRIAILEITSATPERTVARVSKGHAFAVQPGSLLRRIGVGSTGVAAAAIPVTEDSPPTGASPPR